MDCLRAISDGMISVEHRHMNFNSYVQISDCQYNSSAITHCRLSETVKTSLREPSLRNKALEYTTTLKTVALHQKQRQYRTSASHQYF